MDQASSVKCPWYHGFPEFLPRFENSRSDNTFIETPGNRKRVDLSCRLLILSCYSRGCQRAIENGATGALKTGFQRWVIDFSTKVFQILMIGHGSLSPSCHGGRLQSTSTCRYGSFTSSSILTLSLTCRERESQRVHSL